jgi:O-antigen/teichoic acid export membrane protein
MARRVLTSPALQVTLGYGLAGAGWVGANLAMARLLPPEAFAYLTLCIAIIQTACLLGPLGADGIARRGGLRANVGSLFRTAGSSVAVGVVALLAARGVYHLGGTLLVSVFAGTVGGGLCAMAAGHLQGAHRFGAGLLVNQGHLFALLVAAVVELAAGAPTAELPAMTFGVGFLVAAAVGWWLALTRAADVTGTGAVFHWGDAGSFFFIQCAGSLIYQMDRLLIPSVLSVQDLALYGVLASVAGSPFRMLQMGVGFTTIPRLRGAISGSARRALLRTEAKVITLVALAATAVVVSLAVPLVHFLLGQKYTLTEGMVVAVVVTGLIRVLDGFASATASALAVSSQLPWLGVFSWVGVAAAGLGGTVGARWGLVGVIYGIGAGWLVRTLLVGALGAAHLRDESAAEVAGS